MLPSLITSVKWFTNSSYLIQMSFLGHNSRVNQLNQRLNLNNRIRAIRADLPEMLLAGLPGVARVAYAPGLVATFLGIYSP